MKKAKSRTVLQSSGLLAFKPVSPKKNYLHNLTNNVIFVLQILVLCG